MYNVVFVHPITLLVVIGWANSRGEARRMIQGGGLRIDNEVLMNIEPFYFAGSEFIMSYGKRQWIRIMFPVMQSFYTDDAREAWEGG